MRSITYLVTTRLLASAIVLPFAYLLAVASSYLAAFLMSVKRFGDVSPVRGTCSSTTSRIPSTCVYSMTKGLFIAGFVISTAVYFGYKVRGGPIEVGAATARSMAVNIIGVTLISMVGTLIFWGANPRIPIG